MAWLMGRFFCRQTSEAIPRQSISSPVESPLTQPTISTVTDTQTIEHAATEETSSGITFEDTELEIPFLTMQASTSIVTDAHFAETGDVSRTEAKESDLHTTKHCIPVWAAYNSMINTDTATNQQKPIDQVHALPLINAPAHEWQTLTTSRLQIHKLNQLVRNDVLNTPVCVWLDMDLYKRVAKLAYLDPSQYANKWIESPGQFHTVLCALRCLGQTVDSSGLDEAWVHTAGRHVHQCDCHADYNHITIEQYNATK